MAIENLTATTLRNIIGEMERDQTLTSREIINTNMRTSLDVATDPWGIKVNRVELKNIISESVKKFINENEEYRDNYSIVSDYDRFREELADETSEDYNSDSVFEYEIIDRIYEAQKLFESIKQFLEESDGRHSNKEFVLKKLEKINNICDLIYSFWDE